MEQFIEEEFRKVASREIQSAKRRFKEGERYLFDALPENNDNSEYDSQELLNAAGETFAFATELGLKSNIKYDDFRRSPFFNQVSAKNLQFGSKIVAAPVVGTDMWHNALAGNIKPINFISDPKEIRKNIILANDPNDERVNIKTESEFNSQFLTLSKDGSRISGHSLYANNQLQSPVAKNLINTEYYCYVENEFKYTIYALLTEDILTNNNDGKTIMPSSLMEKLDSVKDAAVDLRYASISFDNVDHSDLTFLKEFSSSVINVGEYRFPLPKQYAEINFEQYKYDNFVAKGLPLFDGLDKMTKYYLQSCFNKNEISAFVKYIELLNKTGLSLIDLNVFINNAIYLKNFIKNKMQINLEFTEAQFARIDNFCKLLKAFQPFDSNSKRLCDNDAFSTEEKINVYINKIKQNQEKNKFDIKKDLQKQISIFIDMLNKGNSAILRPGNKETLEGYPEIKLSYFWQYHNVKIQQILFDELKDDSRYDTARKLVENYLVAIDVDKKISIFIDMLNKGNSAILRPGNKETLEGYPSIKLSNFWQVNKHKIIKILFEELYDYPGYDVARNLILKHMCISNIDEYYTKKRRVTFLNSINDMVERNLKRTENICGERGNLAPKDVLYAYEFFDGLDPYTGEKLELNELVLDHIIPVSVGGNSYSWNCIPTSKDTNGTSEKGAKHLIAWWDANFSDIDESRLEKIFVYIITMLLQDESKDISENYINSKYQTIELLNNMIVHFKINQKSLAGNISKYEAQLQKAKTIFANELAQFDGQKNNKNR